MSATNGTRSSKTAFQGFYIVAIGVLKYIRSFTARFCPPRARRCSALQSFRVATSAVIRVSMYVGTLYLFNCPCDLLPVLSFSLASSHEHESSAGLNPQHKTGFLHRLSNHGHVLLSLASSIRHCLNLHLSAQTPTFCSPLSNLPCHDINEPTFPTLCLLSVLLVPSRLLQFKYSSGPRWYLLTFSVSAINTAALCSHASGIVSQPIWRLHHGGIGPVSGSCYPNTSTAG